MQVLRSTSIRRLCLSVTTSVARRPQNTLLPILFRRAESFTTSSPRWYSNASQFEHRVNEESQEEKFDGVEEGKRCVTRHLFAICTLMILDQCASESRGPN